MGRKANWPPRVHFHEKSGQDRVSYRGRYYYLGPAGSDEARVAYVELLGELQKPPGRVAAPAREERVLTISELVDRFVAEARVRYDPAGREAEQFCFSLPPLVRLLPDLPAGDFDLAKLVRVRDEMIKLGWRRQTVNRRVVRVRTVFRWAEVAGLVPPGTWAGLQALKALPANDRRAPSSAPREPAAWRDVLAACRQMEPAARDLTLCLWHTGARPGELRTLRARDVSGGFASPPRHKCAWRGHARRIPLGPKAWAAMRPWLEGVAPGDYVFRTDRGTCYAEDSYRQHVRRACERAGVWFVPYQLRHAARLRVGAELGTEHARAFLGHRTADTTLRYAVGADDALAAEAARKCG